MKNNTMKIRFYGYNTFLIESEDKTIAIDPGATFFYFFRFSSLIPKSEWKKITHIFVTHGDPDHYWHADRVAKASKAPVIFNESMVKEVKGVKEIKGVNEIKGKKLALGPRNKGVAFTTSFNRLHTISVDQRIEVDGISVTGLKATHGPLLIKIGPFAKEVKQGPEERIGWGAMGFDIQVDGKEIVNLGDTFIHLDEWKGIEQPDVLMIPIGGKSGHNTMDEGDALKVVKQMRPRLVIPCHYNCPAFFTKKYIPADDKWFKKEVEKTGAKCVILRQGESIDI